MNDRPLHVLLVEDSPDDIELTERTLGRSEIPVTLSVVENGEDAIAFLRREGAFADAEPADVVLLDLNLPGMDGAEVLKELKDDPILRRVPVVMLTTSSEEEDVLRLYDAYVNAYLTKPIDVTRFTDLARSFVEFWGGHARLPSNRR